MKTARISCIALATMMAVTNPATDATAQSCARDAMLVFDGSASMAEPGSGQQAPTRLEDAQSAVATVIHDAATVRRVGLLIYGPGPENSCQGLNLKFPPMNNAGSEILNQIDQIVPSGLTPLTSAAEAAANVLDYKNSAGIIVLVTDGSETCSGQPCSLGARLAQQAVDLTVHVIGFRLVFDPFSWNGIEDFEASKREIACLAEVTGGRFVETETVVELSEALRETLGCALIG